MKQNGAYRATGRGFSERDLPGIGRRLLPPIIFFVIAFAIDMATSQQYSSIWGSGAIVASVLWLFPSILPTLAAIGTYAAVWVGFNLVRAFAEDAGVALAGENAIADMERRLFGGTLPSAWLQDVLFNPDSIQGYDILLSLVHASFFVVPFSVGGIVLWRHRERFRAYTIATAITFALGLVGFVFLPTAPPWMAEPERVSRVTQSVLSQILDISVISNDGGGFQFEPNHLAAMPSVHVAATVLVYLMVRQFGWIAAIAGAIYALLMSFGVVYLGEHYVIDAVGGWAIALAGWAMTRRIVKEDDARPISAAKRPGEASGPAR